MENTKKLKLNSLLGLLLQFTTLVSGFIIPRFILNYYGSEINGLIASINQFLAIVSFLEMGIGAVVQSALYKPIAQRDSTKVSIIISETRKFFNNIGLVLLAYTFILIVGFPQFTNSPFNILGTAILIVALSLRLLSEYFIGLPIQLFLNANQLNYITYAISIGTVITNVLLSVILITTGFSIQVVKLFSGLIFLAKPLFLKIYVNKKFSFINPKLTSPKSAIPQKWNGIANQVAYTVTNSTDIIVITLFSTFENVSVYSIHNLVVNGIKLFISSLIGGIQSFFGTLIANHKIEELKKYFSTIEWVIHTLVTFIYGLTAVLITPFVMLYTTGIQDVNYYRPVFALLLTISGAFYCLRLPYNELIKSAGHFKQTQKASFTEALINVLITSVTINKLGLIGVAVGTIVAMVFRLIYLVYYLSGNIIFKPTAIFWKQMLVNTISFIFILAIENVIQYTPATFFYWVLYALIISFIYLLFILIINYTFYKDEMQNLFSKVGFINK